MKAPICSSETSVDFQPTTRRCIAEDRKFQTIRYAERYESKDELMELETRLVNLAQTC
jgi:hypothetical protein